MVAFVRSSSFEASRGTGLAPGTPLPISGGSEAWEQRESTGDPKGQGCKEDAVPRAC